MRISRKEFFRQGFLSLGKTALDLAGTLTGVAGADSPVSTEMPLQPEPRPEMYAVAFNDRCLARNCGCLACSEKCSTQALMIVPGVGIRVDENRCTGCGSCEYICPVTPKAVILAPRTGTAHK